MRGRLAPLVVLAVTSLAHTLVCASECRSVDEIGRIEEVVGTARVVHAGESRDDPALIYAPVCKGDRFKFSPGASIKASFMHLQTKTFDAGNPKVPDDLAADAQSVSQTLTAVALFVTQWTGRIGNYRPVAEFNVTREVRPPLLTPDPLLQAGTQYLPVAYSRASFLWDGGPGFLKLQPDFGHIFKSGREANLTIDLPKEAATVTVSPLGQSFHWEIRRSDEVPSMPDLPGAALQTPAGRAARALWILTNGPKEWHLFALSELSGMAAENNYLAEELWAAAKSGQLAELIVGSGSLPQK